MCSKTYPLFAPVPPLFGIAPPHVNATQAAKRMGDNCGIDRTRTGE